MSASELVIHHQRFGEIQTRAEEVVEFPGLPGFPAARRFVVRGHDRSDIFAWLISCDDPRLAFAIVNPWLYVHDYKPQLKRRDLENLEFEETDELQILAISNVQKDHIHLNLAAPLVINLRTRKGIQAILDGEHYSAREAFPNQSPESEAGSS